MSEPIESALANDWIHDPLRLVESIERVESVLRPQINGVKLLNVNGFAEMLVERQSNRVNPCKLILNSLRVLKAVPPSDESIRFLQENVDPLIKYFASIVSYDGRGLRTCYEEADAALLRISQRFQFGTAIHAQIPRSVPESRAPAEDCEPTPKKLNKPRGRKKDPDCTRIEGMYLKDSAQRYVDIAEALQLKAWNGRTPVKRVQLVIDARRKREKRKWK